MRKLALLTTALIFTGANLALALPAAPSGATGQHLSSSPDGEILLVRNDRTARRSRKARRNRAEAGPTCEICRLATRCNERGKHSGGLTA